MSPPQHTFLRKRLEYIEYSLENPGDFESAGKGRFRYRTTPVTNLEYNLMREAGLLEKLLDQVPEGRVDKALLSWRKQLGDKLTVHKDQYRSLQEEYERWLSLPWPIRVDIPEPLAPPECRVVDVNGIEWVVDDHLLALIDDIAERLQKWVLDSEG